MAPRPQVLSPTATALALAALFLAPGIAAAQSNDGFHTIQVIPVVVDTASFTQRFIFRAAFLQPTPVSVRFYPSRGSTQATPLDCPSFEIPVVPRPGRQVFKSLRDLCPALQAGSQFGLLYLRENSPGNLPFAAYSRVSNPQGGGFSVEAFPAHVFGGAPAIVDGIRRLAATATSPAYQSNCFLASLDDTVGPVRAPVTVNYAVLLKNGSEFGASLSLAAGQFVRLLDVFAAVGVPPGDQDDAEFRYVLGYLPTHAAPMVGHCGRHAL